MPLVEWWNCGAMLAPSWQLSHQEFLCAASVITAAAFVTLEITLPLRLRLVPARPLCAEWQLMHTMRPIVVPE